MHGIAARAALVGLLTLRQLGLGPHVRQVPRSAELAQFWSAPSQVSQLNLFTGPTEIDSAAPDTTRPFRFVSRKTSGFSPGYDVRDASGREWSVKLGPEAQSEVAVSRLLWAIGYRQPPVYYIDHWTLDGGPAPGLQTGGRFRPKGNSLKSRGDWSWQHNPFVGTQPYRGLIVAMVLLNSTDLRNENNVIYEVTTSGARERWYVVKDLGATLGETGIVRPVRDDIDAFESDPLFITDSKGHAKFAYRGLQKELLSQVTAEDVRWAVAQFDQLSPRQWLDAFRAAGYSDALASRFIAVIHARLHAADVVEASFNGARSDYWANRHLPQAIRAVESVPKAVAAPFKALH